MRCGRLNVDENVFFFRPERLSRWKRCDGHLQCRWKRTAAHKGRQESEKRDVVRAHADWNPNAGARPPLCLRFAEPPVYPLVTALPHLSASRIRPWMTESGTPRHSMETPQHHQCTAFTSVQLSLCAYLPVHFAPPIDGLNSEASAFCRRASLWAGMCLPRSCGAGAQSAERCIAALITMNTLCDACQFLHDASEYSL